MAGLERLAIEMDNLKKKIEVAVNKETQEVAIVVLETLVKTTRVDTSKALSNWLVSIGSPPSFIINARVPGIAGSTRDASEKSTIDEGTYKIRTRKIKQDINIGNNLPYIDMLNGKDSMEARAIQAGNSRAAALKDIK